MPIIPYEEQYQSQVMELWLCGNLQAHSFVSEEYWRAHFDGVAQALMDAELLLWEEEGRILGFLGLLEGNYIAGVFVSKSRRGQGIGSCLIRECQRIKKELTLRVYQKNKDARRLYERLGFHPSHEAVEEETGDKEFTMIWENNPIR